MKTRKDLIAIIIAVLWLVFNIATFFLFDLSSVVFSNLGCTILAGIVVALKFKNKKFGFWLEQKL